MSRGRFRNRDLKCPEVRLGFRILEPKKKILNRPLDTAAAEPKTKTQPIDTHNHIEAEHNEAKPQSPGTKKSDDDRLAIHTERK